MGGNHTFRIKKNRQDSVGWLLRYQKIDVESTGVHLCINNLKFDYKQAHVIKCGICKGNPHFRAHRQFTTANLDLPARGRPGPAGPGTSLSRTSPSAGPRPLIDAHFPFRLRYTYGLSRTLFLVRFLFGLRYSLALASY